MALPNGDLITTVFDPQMAYPVDKRMQVDTLNSRDSISMFIRWEGMTVYVLEDSKIYILQGGRSNEYWKELGLGSGTGGTTFVGQFATDDLLPTTGRSAGDYAFVGTGDDFVQYNWDNISSQWVMAEGQTDMASEHFHIGYKTPLRRPVIFARETKDVIVETSGDFVFAPETAVARFIFVGEVTAIRGVETAAADREIKLVNRTGSDTPLRDKASGIPSDSGFDFGGTDYTWVNGSEITLKGNGTYWQLAPNNQVAFSDHLDSVNAEVSVGSDGLKVWTGFIDNVTKVPVTFKQLNYVPEVVDGRIFRQIGSEYFGDAEFLETRTFNVLKFGGDNTGSNFSDIALTIIRLLYQDGDKITFPHGTYKFANVQNFNKSVQIDFGDSTIICDDRDGFVFTGVEKSTHTATANYTEGYGNPTLTLNNTAGIEVGDLINIISTELFDTGRDYNYKGGNFLITRVNGNVVTFDGSMPFDMTAASITVKIYKPLSVKLNNIKRLTNTRAVASTLYGIRLFYCKNSMLENIHTDNFRFNIDIYRTVNASILNSTTGHAKDLSDAQSGNYDAYGVAIESSTNVTCTNVRTDSGQHGMTNGGREVSYNLTFNDCVFKSEDDSSGWGSHANIWNKVFNDCTFFGASFNGNVTCNNCDIFSISAIIGNLAVSDRKRNSNYIFNDCRLYGNFRVRDYSRTLQLQRIHIGSIVFNRCENPDVRTELSLLTTEGKIANIGRFEFNDSQNCTLLASDYINTLVLNRSSRNGYLSRMVDFNTVEDRISGADTVILNEVTLGDGGNIGMRLRNVAKVYANNLILPSTDGVGLYAVELENIGELIIENSDLTKASRDFNLVGYLNKLTVKNVKLNYLGSDGSWQNFIDARTEFYSDDLYVTTTQSSKKYNIRTTPDGTKYNEYINDSGRKFIGSNEVAYVSDLPGSSSYIRAGRYYTLDNTYLNRYIRFTYADGLSSIQTIAPDSFSAGDELIGEVEGSGLVFAPGVGVTLRYPDGQGLNAPTGSKFSIKFKSPNDALVTIIKPYTSTEILSATATLNFPVIAIGETATLTATVTGAALLDPVVVSAPASVYNANNSMVDAWVSAANTVTVRISNNGESSIDPDEGQFKIKVFK